MNRNDEKRVFDSLVTQVSSKTPQGQRSFKNGSPNIYSKPKTASKLSGFGGMGKLGPGKPLLAPQKEPFKGRKTLVLDIDETLVHSSFKDFEVPDMIIPVILEGQKINVQILKRPGVDEFLDKMMDIYEVVFFTASLSKYANPLIDRLDPQGKSAGRLFRQHCTFTSCGYVKDLRRLSRNLSNIIIIDNSPVSFKLQPTNAIPIKSWFTDRNDRDMIDLIPVLEQLALTDDVRPVLMKLTEMGFSNMRGNFFTADKYAPVIQAEISRIKITKERKFVALREKEEVVQPSDDIPERLSTSKGKRDSSLVHEKMTMTKGPHSHSTSALLSQPSKYYTNGSPKHSVMKRGNRLVTVNSLMNDFKLGTIKTDGMKKVSSGFGAKIASRISAANEISVLAQVPSPDSKSSNVSPTHSPMNYSTFSKKQALKSKLKPLSPGVVGPYDPEGSMSGFSPKDDLMINSPNSRYATGKQSEFPEKMVTDSPIYKKKKRHFDFSASSGIGKRSKVRHTPLRQSLGLTGDPGSLQFDSKSATYKSLQTSSLKSLEGGTIQLIKKSKLKGPKHPTSSIGTRTSIKKILVSHPSK